MWLLGDFANYGFSLLNACYDSSKGTTVSQTVEGIAKQSKVEGELRGTLFLGLILMEL